MFLILPRIILITLMLIVQGPSNSIDDSIALPRVELRDSAVMEYFGYCGGLSAEGATEGYYIILSQHCVTSNMDYFILLAHEVAHWYHYTYMGAEGWEGGRSEAGARLIDKYLCSYCPHTGFTICPPGGHPYWDELR